MGFLKDHAKSTLLNLVTDVVDDALNELRRRYFYHFNVIAQSLPDVRAVTLLLDRWNIG